MPNKLRLYLFMFKCGSSRDNGYERWARDKQALMYTSVGDIEIEQYIHADSTAFDADCSDNFNLFFTIQKNFCLLAPDRKTVYQTQISVGNMVLTNAQTTAFFENGTQMAIPRASVMQLSNEEIATVSDLVEFERSSLQ